MDHGHLDPRLTAWGIVFLVLRQTPIAMAPAKGPLPNPPPLADRKLRWAGPLARHRQHPPAMVLDPVEQGPHPVRRVGPPLRQAGQGLAHPPEDFDRPIPVRRGGRQDGQPPDQPERIHEQMPLATGDFFLRWQTQLARIDFSRIFQPPTGVFVCKMPVFWIVAS